MSLSVLPPLYSIGAPLMKYFKVGYPETPYCWAFYGCSVASNLAKTIFEPLLAKLLAALAYSGANCLQ
jgi:hypothetical protein